MNLDAYFSRIGYAGERAATLDVLRAIVVHHTAAIPFETIEPRLHRTVRLDLPSLEQKLVRERRGGYCFEQNILLWHVLEALGFQVSGLGARVLWNMPAGTLNPRSHMLLRLDVEGSVYLVDVGFGGPTLTGVLRLEPDIEQTTPHEPFRLLRTEGDLTMQAKFRDQWKSLYRFDMQRQHACDYEVSSFYLCNYPASPFRKILMLASATPEGRLALRDNELAVHPKNGETTRETLCTAPALRDAIERRFGVVLPADPAISELLAQIALLVSASSGRDEGR